MDSSKTSVVHIRFPTVDNLWQSYCITWCRTMNELNFSWISERNLHQRTSWVDYISLGITPKASEVLQVVLSHLKRLDWNLDIDCFIFCNLQCMIQSKQFFKVQENQLSHSISFHQMVHWLEIRNLGRYLKLHWIFIEISILLVAYSISRILVLLGLIFE